jgi:hypothetical protein
MSEDAVGRLAYARSPAGMPIAEIELAPGETGRLTELACEAARHGARRLCIYSTADLGGASFERREGYRRLTADDVPVGAPLPVLDAAAVRDMWPRSCLGQWAITLSSRGLRRDCVRNISWPAGRRR